MERLRLLRWRGAGRRVWWELSPSEGGYIDVHFWTLENWDATERMTHQEWRASVDTRERLLDSIGTAAIEHPALGDGVIAVLRAYGQLHSGSRSRTTGWG